MEGRLLLAYLLQEMVQKQQSGYIYYMVKGGQDGKIFVSKGIVSSVTYQDLPINASELGALAVRKAVVLQNIPGPTVPSPHTPDALSVWQALQQEGGFTMAYLEVHADNEAVRQLTLGNVLSIGRQADNDVVLHHGRVSRYHARITRNGERFLLEDLASSNGTFLREQRLPPEVPSELRDGDEIHIGSNHLAFHLRMPRQRSHPFDDNGSRRLVKPSLSISLCL
jgi:hypothetical protein